MSSFRRHPLINVIASPAHDAVTMVIGTAISETSDELITARPSGTSVKASE